MTLRTILNATGLIVALLLAGFASAAISDRSAKPLAQSPFSLAYFHIKQSGHIHQGEHQWPRADHAQGGRTCVWVHHFEKRISVYQKRYCQVPAHAAATTAGLAPVNHTF
ncbi:hypothetical protein [Ketobacter sp.]|uniref:hypothetical protein n=1 Tax=Ketobacter sp. TaxID=2083498 RepID=UPI000F2AADAB|nr:hypothetical protein [Ketobacter sp.]RLT96024.1 MAG: hypothetical protein D9N14_14125 [Ketobacter sp.]